MEDSKFMTSKEKETVLKQWVTFVKNDFDEAKFTKRLYDHLIQHCSFIAHYDKKGFYSTYFENPRDTMHFLKQFDKESGNKSIEYGGMYWLVSPDYNDINQAMCEAIEPYKANIYQSRLVEEKRRDLSLATSLLKKHGINIDI